MTMSKLDVTTDPTRERDDRRRIDEAWVKLNDARDAELLSAAQMTWILEREPPTIDDHEGCPGLVVQLWRIMIERYARDPRGVGANVDALRTFACAGGCSDTGMIETEDADGTRWAKPCKVCRPIPYTRWLDCWSQGPGHSCEKCSAPRGRQRTLVDEARDDAADRRQGELDGLA